MKIRRKLRVTRRRFEAHEQALGTLRLRVRVA